MSVNTIISDANARSDTALIQAQSFIDQLASLADANEIELSSNWNLSLWHNWLYDYAHIPVPADTSTEKLSGLNELTLDSIVPSGDSDYFNHALPNVWVDGQLPEFTEIAPVITAPEAPITEMPIAPSAYDIESVSLQEWLQHTLPTDVVLTENPLPAPNVLGIQAVDLSVPNLNLAAPSNTFTFVENDYSSTMLSVLDNLLLDEIQNGGHGIDPTDEQGIYDRARDREAKQTAAAVTRVRRGTASRGFPVPPGSLYAAERTIYQEGDAALSGLNREIVLKRSDLYVQARQFAVQQGISLEQALLSYVGSKQERTLRASEATADFTIKFHNAGVQLFQLQVEIKRLYRDLHGEHLQTVAAKVQEYEQQLAYSGAEDKRNQTRLALHQQLLASVRLAYEAQQFEDQRTQLTLDLERLKLQASQDRVNIYATQVKARADEYSAYRIAWQAEETKQGAFTQKLAAHDQQVETVTKTSKLKQDRFDAEVKRIDTERERYTMLLQERGTQLREAVAKIEAFARANNEDIDMWKTGKAADQFNISNDLQRDVEYANKLLDAEKTNINLLSASATAILGLKELNGASAQAGLALYEKLITGAENQVSAIGTVSE